MEESPGSISDAGNVEDGINLVLKNVLYHLSKPSENDDEQVEIRGAQELNDFKNTINQLIQNILIITKKFKDKFSDTIDPFFNSVIQGKLSLVEKSYD